MNDIRAQVRAFVLDELMMGGDREGLADDASFLDQRIIDSTGFMELVTFLEETYGIQVADEEIVPENLDSLNAIAAYVTRKRVA